MQNYFDKLSTGKRGFTIIELIVVIAIIAVLASIILVNVKGFQVKARDARRKADFYTIRTALLIFHGNYGYYPVERLNCGGGDWASSHGTCGGKWLTEDQNFWAILPNVPVDPVNSGYNPGSPTTDYAYGYFRSSNPIPDYELLTQLENPNDPDRCEVSPKYYHNAVPIASWCGEMGRSGMIYTDH